MIFCILMVVAGAGAIASAFFAAKLGAELFLMAETEHDIEANAIGVTVFASLVAICVAVFFAMLFAS